MNDTMDSIICCSCKSTELTIKTTVGGYNIYKCNNCNLNKVYPSPNSDELQKLYSGIDRNIAKGAVLGEINTFKENSSQVISVLDSMRINPLKTFFPKLNTQSTICDVGCGSGIYLAALQKLGYTNLYGIEFNVDSVELINQNFNFKVVQGEIKENINIPKADLLTAFDVLEHVPNPDEVLQEMHKMLKDDEGYIHIRVPSYGSLWAKIFGSKWLWMIPPFHLNYFDIKSLKTLAENNGFSVIKIRSRRSGYRIAFWFLQLKKLLSKNIDSFDSSSYSKKNFFLINMIEYTFRVIYFPIYIVVQLFDADDCLELYAKKKKGK